MIYKLYKDRSKSPEPEGAELFEEFNKIYEAHEVRVVGVWQNISDPQEYYFMTAYRDDAHYNSFVEEMKSNERYKELSSELEKDRESIEAVTLKDAFA